ncbi:hypothetical protein [Pantoea dispersa]|uniref:hypothetical protein n=1 Tax=Pantoea dispersa TaxID=59814 RepID=UPI000B029A63|nr:hypothetical protein [Pantoea dispersa]
MNVFVYLLSSLFMFFIGNMQEWLKPLLVEHGAPPWVYNSFGFYAIIFVAAGLLNTWVIKVLSPKSFDEKELKNLRKQCKSNEREKKSAIGRVTADKDRERNNEIFKLKSEHQKEHKEKDSAHRIAISRLEATIKTKDSFIESMTHQLAEKYMVIDEYNKETNINGNKPINHQPKPVNGMVPDISDYTT